MKRRRKQQVFYLNESNLKKNKLVKRFSFHIIFYVSLFDLLNHCVNISCLKVVVVQRKNNKDFRYIIWDYMDLTHKEQFYFLKRTFSFTNFFTFNLLENEIECAIYWWEVKLVEIHMATLFFFQKQISQWVIGCTFGFIKSLFQILCHKSIILQFW